jgi:hypothetical protein
MSFECFASFDGHREIDERVKLISTERGFARPRVMRRRLKVRHSFRKKTRRGGLAAEHGSRNGSLRKQIECRLTALITSNCGHWQCGSTPTEKRVTNSDCARRRSLETRVFAWSLCDFVRLLVYTSTRAKWRQPSRTAET